MEIHFIGRVNRQGRFRKRVLISARDSIGGAGKKSPSDRVSLAGRIAIILFY